MHFVQSSLYGFWKTKKQHNLNNKLYNHLNKSLNHFHLLAQYNNFGKYFNI